MSQEDVTKVSKDDDDVLNLVFTLILQVDDVDIEAKAEKVE